MPPYASLYPARASADAGPVHILFGLGAGQDHEEHLMSVDTMEEEVVKEVLLYRDAVPMDVDRLRWEGAGADEVGQLTVVLDTNVLLSHLDLLRNLVSSVSAPSAFLLTLIVPSIVFLELDGLKSSNRINSSASSNARTPVSTLARNATNWLLDATDPKLHPESGCRVRGQRRKETLIPEGVDGRLSAEGTGGAGGNDSLILDAAAYFATTSERVVLLTDDKNLRLRARNEEIEAAGVESGWDEEDLMDVLDGGWRGKVELRRGVVKQEGRSKHAPSSPTKARSRPPSPAQHRRSPPQRHSPAPVVHIPSPSPTPPPRPPPAPVFHAMDIDLPTSAALSPTARLLPPTSPSAILENTSATFSQLLAKPLHARLCSSSRLLDPPRTAWKEWTGRDAARALSRNWHDCGMERLCRAGVERLMASDTQERADAKHVTKRLASVRGSLSNLEHAWDHKAGHSADSWSAAKWEVVLDEISLVLTVVLLGLFGETRVGEGLAREVAAIGAGWRAELRAVGVALE